MAETGGSVRKNLILHSTAQPQDGYISIEGIKVCGIAYDFDMPIMIRIDQRFVIERASQDNGVDFCVEDR